MKPLAAILGQTSRNLQQTWGTQVMTLITVILSVLIFAFFALVYTNMLRAGEKLSEDVRLVIYLHDEPNPELQQELVRKIKNFDDVEKIAFISREEAWNRLAGRLGEEKDVLDGLEPRFLPPSIEVHPKKDLKSLTKIKGFSDYLATLPGALKVQSGHYWLERFGHFTDLLRIITVLSGGLLIFTTTFMVSYTIRLTLITRSEEIAILRLLGATSSYIKGPLLLEGMLQGILGAGLGLAALYSLFGWITERFSGPGFLKVFEFSFFPPETLAGFALVSILLCTGGSLISIRKFFNL